MCFYKYCPLCKHFTLHSDFLVTLTNLIHHRVCYPTEKHECWKPFGGWKKPFRFIWILHRRRHFHCQHHHHCICNCLCICHLQHHEWRQPVWLIWIPSRFATQRPICLQCELNNHFDKDIGEIIQICFWHHWWSAEMYRWLNIFEKWNNYIWETRQIYFTNEKIKQTYLRKKRNIWQIFTFASDRPTSLLLLLSCQTVGSRNV